MAEYLTIPNVELVSVGMKWKAAAGELTFTFEHLADAMTAANDDPHIKVPRLKIGHTDPRFADENDPGHDPFYDGEPAFGKVENLRLVNDGAMLIGDYVEVPAWLAESLPSAYPSRSIEGGYTIEHGPGGEPMGTWDVETPGGKRYSFVLTACALLGLYRPAVQDLEDLERLLTTGDGVVVTDESEEGGAAASGEMKPVGKLAPSALADQDKVVETFWHEFAQDERYWWWPRSLWTDPNFIVADDDEGSLWRVPFSSDDSQQVAFAEPTKVLQTFVDAPAEARSAVAAAASAAGEGDPVATFKDRKDAGCDAARQGGARPSATNDGMDDAAELRKVLGLEPDASDEEVQSALAEREEGNGGGDPDPEPTPDPDPADPADPGEGDPDPEPAGGDGGEPGEGDPPAAASDTVTIDRETWERTQRGAEDGAQARQEQRESKREALLSQAVKDGKFPPARMEHYRELHKADAKGTEELIEKLESGVIPVDERGTSKTEEANAASQVQAAVTAMPGMANRRQS